MQQHSFAIYDDKEKVRYEFYYNCEAALYVDKSLLREIINITSYKVPNSPLADGIKVIKRIDDKSSQNITQEVIQKYSSKFSGGNIVNVKIPWREFGVQIFF